MKKFIVSIFAVFYLAVSSGFTINMHYCMGKLADWELGHNKSKTCSRCGMKKTNEKDNGCCKDEHKFIKSNTDQKVAETEILLIQLAGTALPVPAIESPVDNFSSIAKEYPVSHAPPRSSGLAVYIRNRVFLI